MTGYNTTNTTGGNITRYALGSLLLVLSISAFAGGYYGMAGARDIPTAWLKGSPFQNYFIPGLILFVCIGGSALVAALMVFRRQAMARKAAFMCGLITLFWLAVQVAVIGYVSWMQPVTAIATLIILFLTWKLSDHGH